jgi:PEP-CTERM motif
MNRFLASLLHLCTILAVTPSAVFAGPVTTPPGLSPGDTYRLVYVTSATTEATSADISYYNTFVTADANSFPALAALDTTWTAIGSTSTVAADNNTGTNPAFGAGSPIYNLAGQLVAANNADLWSVPAALIIDSEAGTTTYTTPSVWTGTAIAGDVFNEPLGNLFSVGSTSNPPEAYVGNPNAPFTPNSWINDAASASLNNSYDMYAISGVITVPTPEPSSVLLACLAAAGLWCRTLPIRRRARS